MRETQADIDWLQRLLDESYERAGVHLREIHTQAARVHAEDLVRRLDGMQVSVVAAPELLMATVPERVGWAATANPGPENLRLTSPTDGTAG